MPYSRRSRISALASLLLAAALASTVASAAATSPDEPDWVASWQASPQPVWNPQFLFPTNIPAQLSDQTVRQTARVSIGGRKLRLVMSNAYGDQPVRIGRVTVGRPDTDGTAAPRTVTFGGLETVTVLPGAQVLSDAVPLPVAALTRLAVNIHLPQATPLQGFHWDGRQTAWILPGDRTLEPRHPPGDAASSTTARLLLTGIQVQDRGHDRRPAQAVAVIGDSITDGAAASLDKDRRWPDFLAARLAAQGVGVVNAGISGARLLSDGMGVNALARLDRDVLSQAGVRSVIVMLGINDIAWPGTAFAPQGERPTLEAMVAGYRQLIAQAHGRAVRVVGATLTPFEGALPGTPLADYYQADKDTLRGQVNEWIRHGGAFDAVIDFDSLLRDPEHPSRLASRFDSGDRLHPGDEGNRAMAEAVDLATLLPAVRPLPPGQARRRH